MIFDTPESIAFYQLAARTHALGLELHGMHRRGRSAYSICKEVYGLRGNRERVHAQMEALVEEAIAKKHAQDASLSLIDKEQGVCFDGHPCHLVRDEDGQFWRVCAADNLDDPDETSHYVGRPLIRLDATLEDVKRAAELGASKSLVAWARSAIDDRRPDDPSHEHTTDHNYCDRDDHLRRRDTGEDCPFRVCLECGMGLVN